MATCSRSFHGCKRTSSLLLAAVALSAAWRTPVWPQFCALATSSRWTRTRNCQLHKLGRPAIVAPERAISGARQLPRIGQIFPIANVTNSSSPKLLAGWLSGTFANNSGLVGMDLCSVGGNRNSALLYTLAYLSNDKDASYVSQILPRQRDGRFRVRLFRNVPVEEDADPELFTISSQTDHQKLAWAMRSQLRPGSGDTRHCKSTVQLRLVGREAAEQALLAVEELYWRIRREITFRVFFEERSIPTDEARKDTAGMETKPQLVVSITST